MSPVAVMLTIPPLPHPAPAVQAAPEFIKEPADNSMLCADTVTEPASPEPKLDALILLVPPVDVRAVESSVSLPPAVTVMLPAPPQPEPRVQRASEEMAEPASSWMF